MRVKTHIYIYLYLCIQKFIEGLGEVGNQGIQSLHSIFPSSLLIPSEAFEGAGVRG